MSEPQVDGDLAYIRLSNAEESAYSVAVELVELTTGETIATTGRIDPGYYLEAIHLSAPLSPGAHMCLARLHIYSADGVTYIGTGGKHVLVDVK